MKSHNNLISKEPEKIHPDIIKKNMIYDNNKLLFWAYKYHKDNKSIVTDLTYNKHYKRLLKLEKEYGFRLKNSVSQIVGAPSATIVNSRSSRLDKNTFYVFKEPPSIDMFAAEDADKKALDILYSSLYNFGGKANPKTDKIDFIYQTKKGYLRVKLDYLSKDKVSFSPKRNVLTVTFADKGKDSYNEIILIKMPKLLRNVDKIISKYKEVNYG